MAEEHGLDIVAKALDARIHGKSRGGGGRGSGQGSGHAKV
jgi:hypothetical protein